MKLNEIVLANALGILGFLYFVACYLIALFAPDLYKMVAQSWFHMIDLSNAWKSGPDGFLIGVVSSTVFFWISGWVLGLTYNSLLKK